MSTGFRDFSLTAHMSAPSSRQLYMINISFPTTLNNSYFHVHNPGGGGGELDPCLGIGVPLGVWNPDPV